MFMLPHGRTPPVCAKQPSFQRHFGVTLPDDYAWLRDPDWARVLKQPSKLSEEIRTHLRAENAFTHRVLRQAKKQKDWLLKSYIDGSSNSCSVPILDGGYHYYTRIKKGYDYPFFCRKSARGKNPREQVMLNLNKYARRHKYVALGHIEISPNHRYLGYTLDTTGGEFYTLYVVDLKTGETVLRVRHVDSSFEWGVGSKQIFYVTLDENGRNETLYRQSLQGGHATAILSTEETDGYLFINRSISNSFFIIGVGPRGAARIYVLPTRRPNSKPQLLCPARPDTEYQVEHANRHFYILETEPKAIEGRLRSVNDRSFSRGRTAWRTIVKHKQGRKLEDFALVRGWLVMLQREKGKQKLLARNLITGQRFSRTFGNAPYTVGFGPAGSYSATEYINFKKRTIRLHQKGLTHTTKTLELCLNTQALKVVEAPTITEKELRVRTVYATSHDGTQVPITLLYRKDLVINGDVPVLLRAYGGYGLVYEFDYTQNNCLLAKQGAIVAIAHIRGGGELGSQWHHQGRLRQRVNTFKDYIACAEHLIAKGYTKAGRIVGYAGSAGGTLMGAVANMRPELFAGIVADVPFLDVVTDMMDKTLPLTVGEFGEFGNPLSNKDDFHYMLGYCPYRNIKAQAYPPILANTLLCDQRVGYWEAAKWVAKLREYNTGDSVILLNTGFHGGHAGASSYSGRCHEMALIYSFILHCLGITC